MLIILTAMITALTAIMRKLTETVLSMTTGISLSLYSKRFIWAIALIRPLLADSMFVSTETA